MEGINVVFITKTTALSLSVSFHFSFVALKKKKKKDDISASIGVRRKVNAGRQMTNDLKMATSSVL